MGSLLLSNYYFYAINPLFSIQNIAAFYVNDCSMRLDDHVVSLVEKNCYAKAFGAKLTSPKVTSLTSEWQFTSFIIGRGQTKNQMVLQCNLKICSKDETKCLRNLSESQEQCPNKNDYDFTPS